MSGVIFFFQAEDGIRDGTVTGVQTCALPICTIGIEMVPRPSDDRPLTVRADAIARLAEARQLYDVARVVRSRQPPTAVDSAVLVHRALLLLFRLLSRLQGGAEPESMAELVARAHAINVAESLTGEDLEPAFALIERMRDRFLEGE